jgi:hypothetical protein
MAIVRELGLFQPTVVEVLPDAWLHTYDYCRCAFVFSDDCPPLMQFDGRLRRRNKNQFFSKKSLGKYEAFFTREGVFACRMSRLATEIVFMLSIDLAVKSSLRRQVSGCYH